MYAINLQVRFFIEFIARCARVMHEKELNARRYALTTYTYYVTGVIVGFIFSLATIYDSKCPDCSFIAKARVMQTISEPPLPLCIAACRIECRTCPHLLICISERVVMKNIHTMLQYY